MTAPTLPRHHPPASPPAQIPYLAVAAILFVAAILGLTAQVSMPAAAILYVPFFMALCWFRPDIAVWIMFAEVAFPYNVSGGELVHMAPAEISLCLAFPIFWLRAVGDRRPRVPNPILAPVIAYFLVCVISSLVSWSGRDAIISILQMFIYLVLAVKFFSYCVPNQRHWYAALAGLITSCTVLSIVMVLFRQEYILGIHKNATGTFLSYSVIILTELWLSAATTKSRKRWLAVLLAVNIGGLVMSTSRGAWLGAGAGLGVLLLCRRQYGLFAKALCLIIPAIALFWIVMPQDQRDYAFSFNNSSENVNDRINTIAVYKEEFMQSPVIGVGVGLRKEVDSTNIIMSTLAETGVTGLTTFLAIQVIFFGTVIAGIRAAHRNHPDLTFLALGMALVICLFMHGCVDHYWARTQLPVWGMAGAAIAVRGRQRAAAAGRPARKAFFR